MFDDRTVRIKELLSWWRALFRPRENDREANSFVKPGPAFPYASSPYPIPREKSERYGTRLKKLSRFAVQRDMEYGRPLRYLLAREYQGTSCIALMRLPVKAIRSTNAALASKLTQIGIISVEDLAKASTKKLEATRIPQGQLALAHSYAKDILKHATVPKIAEYRLPLEEMLKPKYAKRRGKFLLDLPIDAIEGIGKATAKKIGLAGVANRIGDLRDVTYGALVAASVSSKEAHLIADYSGTILEHAQPMLPKKPELGTLRVLMFDGVLRLGQKVSSDDPSAFALPEYSLDKPNEGREPEQIAAEPYVGYIISADEIVICEAITTNGNDLVLAAKTIRVGDTGPITINTKPTDFAEVANEETDGLPADNGGDLVFLCQEYSILPGCVFLTSGGTGQDGGAGKSMTKVDPIEEGLHIDKPEWIGSIPGIFLGTFGEGQCKFHVDPNDWISGESRGVPISYSDYNNGVFGAPVDITGEWTLWGSIQNGAPRYLTFVSIPDPCYPTSGWPGGYGGNPGKISLVMPKPSDAEGIDVIQVQAATGSDGKPGVSGKGGDWTPNDIMRGGLPVPVPDYIREYSIDKAVYVSFGEPGAHVPRDTFSAIRDERLDSGQIQDRLRKSMCGAKFAADIQVVYAPNLVLKRRGEWREHFVSLGAPWPLRIAVASKWAGGGYQSLGSEGVNNVIAPPRQASLRLYLDDAPRAAAKPALPTEKQNLQSLSRNWHQAIFELLPEHPLKQYKQADKAYRRGDFDLAAELYGVVLSFAQEVPDFQADQTTVVSDAGYRLDRISAGYDYFGFRADTIIPTSPTRDYFPPLLATAYSDTVQFYQTAIRDTHDSIATIETGKEVLRQFWQKHQWTITGIQGEVVLLEQLDLPILEAETEALVQEINALRWQNQRLSGLLQRWAQRVNDKIKELEKQKEDQGAGWWNAVIAVWSVIELLGSIVALCAGFVSAVAASVDAIKNIGKLGDNINDLRLGLRELVGNLTGWESEQIREYLDVMGGVAKEIEAWYTEVQKAWKEADSKLQDVKKMFSETRAKLDQLSATQMTEPEAIDFQNNVLLADEIGVSGAMDYLQIQEQIYLNNDMMEARYHSMEALTERRVKLTYQALSLARELAAYTAESKYLGELLDVHTWNLEQKQVALRHLTNVGQHSLDALMHRLARQTRQLKFLKLDTQPSTGTYAYFIREEAHVGAVLQAKDQLIADMMDWIEENNNIARLEVAVTKDRNYAGNPGGITIIAPQSLAKFSRGQHLRPSRIIEIEPLRETLLVRRLAEAISNRRSDPGDLARLLISQFLAKEGNAWYLIPPESLGFDVSPEVISTILSRERNYHLSLSTSPAGKLDDTTVVLSYALAHGGVTLLELASILKQTDVAIPDPLTSRLEALRNAWVALSSDINGEQAKSVRSMVEAIQQAAGNAADMRTILDEGLIADGQFVWLGRFHLDQQDISEEITNSYDPVIEEAVLARVYGAEPGHVVAAVTLLYAGLDTTKLESLAGQYATDPNPLGDCIANVLRPHWDALRASVLEKRHSIEISITRDDYMAVPNAGETFREMRYLAARAKIEPGIDLHLEKLPHDLYLRKTEGSRVIALEFQFENADDEVSQAPIATPTGLNVADVHFCDLFGRSILGNWALNFTYKGNRPALPALDLVEFEFLYTYVEHD